MLNLNININTTYDLGVRRYFAKIFGFMAFFILTTSAWVMFLYSNPVIIFKPYFQTLLSIAYFAMIAQTLFFAFILDIQKISAKSLFLLLFIFANTTGICISPIAFLYTMSSILNILLVTSFIFAITAIYGYTTKTDLSPLRNFLVISFWGIFIVSMFNIFMQNSLIEVVISIFSVIINAIFISYHMQALKNVYTDNNLQENTEHYNKFVLIGSYLLYSAFLNIFLRLLRLFGKRNNS